MPVTASTGCLGFMHSSSGLLNVAAAIGCLHRGLLPPVTLLQQADAALAQPLPLVVGAPRPVPDASIALINGCAEHPVAVAGAAIVEVVR